MNTDTVYSTLFLILAISFIVFLVFREFFTWYWKQNRIVKLLESIDGHLEILTLQLQVNEDKQEEIETTKSELGATSKVVAHQSNKYDIKL